MQKAFCQPILLGVAQGEEFPSLRFRCRANHTVRASDGAKHHILGHPVKNLPERRGKVSAQQNARLFTNLVFGSSVATGGVLPLSFGAYIAVGRGFSVSCAPEVNSCLEPLTC